MYILKPQKNNNLELIQFLRAIASILVVLLHCTVNVNEKLGLPFLGNVFQFGGAGVDVFFVLSGFIITYTSFKKLSHIDELPLFFRRRFVRIYPTYWIIISGFLFLQLLLPSFYPSLYSFTLTNLLSTYLLLPGHTMVNGVSWTLSCELFFYVVFTLGFLVRDVRFIYVLSAVYIAFIILLSFTNYNFYSGNNWILLITFPMNIEFFMGVLAVPFIRFIRPRYAVVFILFGLVLFILGAVLTNQGIQFNNSFNRVIFFGFPSFLAVVGVVKYELSNKVKLPQLALLLGEASYSIYLIHLPLVAAAVTIIARMQLVNTISISLLMIFVILLIITVSAMFYSWVEKPMIGKLNQVLGQKSRQRNYLTKPGVK